MQRKQSLEPNEGLTLVADPETKAIEGGDVWGVGVLFPKKEMLPEWAQNQMRLIEMFYTHKDGAWFVLPGVGYKGKYWSEFVGPKWEGEIEDVE